MHVVRSIYQHEGIGALWRGFLLAQLVWGPYNAVYLPMWEGTKRLCVKLSGAESVEKLGVHYELGSSFVSAAFAAGLTNPMVSFFSDSPSVFSRVILIVVSFLGIFRSLLWDCSLTEDGLRP